MLIVPDKETLNNVKGCFLKIQNEATHLNSNVVYTKKKDVPNHVYIVSIWLKENS
jgi:hypothetical protein